MTGGIEYNRRMASIESTTQKRIERAWASCKGWITEIKGSPAITLYANVPTASLFPAIQAIAQDSENFRLTAIPAAHPDQPQFIPLESFPDNLALLQEDKLAELSANYTIKTGAFELDLHPVVFPMKAEKAAIQLVWWNDQVFLEETDPYVQFKSLMNYFIDLQALFSAQNLFVSPETGEDPSQGLDSWVEI